MEARMEKEKEKYFLNLGIKKQKWKGEEKSEMALVVEVRVPYPQQKKTTGTISRKVTAVEAMTYFSSQTVFMTTVTTGPCFK